MWVIFKIKYAAFCNFCCYSNYYGTFYSWKSTSGISQTLKLYWKENLVQYWDLVLWVYFSKPIAFPNLSLLITIFTRHFTSNFQMPSLEAQLVNIYCGGNDFWKASLSPQQLADCSSCAILSMWYFVQCWIEGNQERCQLLLLNASMLSLPTIDWKTDSLFSPLSSVGTQEKWTFLQRQYEF